MEQYVFFDELPKKIARAIDLFRTFEAAALRFRPEGYYLAFSGGKDSVTIYWLAKMAGVKFTAHYHLTTVDPPELVRFVRKDYPEVQVEKPELTMWELIVKKQIPPLRRARYCCEVLKEQGGEGAFTVTGVRWQESRKREKRSNLEILTSNDPIYLNCDNEESRRQVETCALKGKRVLNPIIDWTEEEYGGLSELIIFPIVSYMIWDLGGLVVWDVLLQARRTERRNLHAIPSMPGPISVPLTAWWRPGRLQESQREAGRTGRACFGGGCTEMEKRRSR